MNNRKRQQRRAVDMLIRSKSCGRYGLGDLSEMLGNLAETFAPLVTALSDFAQRLSRAAHAFYEEDVQMQYAGWIRVDERLPDVEAGTDVLVYDRCGGIYTGRYVGAGKWELLLGSWEDAYLDDVTHWMPLPEPPESVT